MKSESIQILIWVAGACIVVGGVVYSYGQQQTENARTDLAIQYKSEIAALRNQHLTEKQDVRWQCELRIAENTHQTLQTLITNSDGAARRRDEDLQELLGLNAERIEELKEDEHHAELPQ